MGWSLALALLVLGPGLGDGFLLVRDMVWVPDLALRSDVLGLGSGLPRAVPSDAVVAVLDEVVPGLLLQKLVLVGALAAGGVGATRLLPAEATLVPRLAAVSLYGWNALVAERLLMGAWPLLVGYAVLPWLLAAARRWREDGRLPAALLVLLPLGSLSASAGLAGAVALLAGAAGRGRTARAVLLVAVANAPWWVAGLLHAGSATSDAAAAGVFALRGEGSVPAPLAALTLGGIWNTQVHPGSRTGALGWVALLALVGLAALGVRAWWRGTAARDRTTLLVCWAVGWALGVLTWLVPGAFGWAADHVPGAGVVRDGARALVLCAPLLVVLVAHGVRVLVDAVAVAPARAVLGVGAVLLPVALLPDLGWGARQRLEPATYPAAYAEARDALAGTRGDVLVLPLSSYRAPAYNHGGLVLDPLGRVLRRDYVASDVLVVDGVALAGEDPRVTAAARALEAPTPERRAAGLAALGIGAVATDRTAPAGADQPDVAGERLVDDPTLQVTGLADVRERHVPAGWRAAMALAWAAFVGGPLAAVSTAVRRRRTRR
ncbi:hypothetical protein G5V58_07480 [Nocardioides anomalus]|uniref:YfhO family protein n=1 Tax=Nocardioides anomalus TaxID=2712223 RepID=A0A6G6WBC9_9ACTN|nr:hypothetical protein [Nocardioides anomalus]QIG42638.1 hypothetical protein G5V58_07480 [Nocardioides anomalus]